MEIPRRQWGGGSSLEGPPRRSWSNTCLAAAVSRVAVDGLQLRDVANDDDDEGNGKFYNKRS